MRINVIILLFLSISCSSQPLVKINSKPEGAEVFSKKSDGQMSSLGKTPLQVRSSDLASGDERVVSLLISKDGHQEQKIILGRDAKRENYDINIVLASLTEDFRTIDVKDKQERLAKNIARAQNLMTNKRYDEARSVLTNVIQEYPYISVGHDLMGTLFYLRKDLKTALSHYERSLQINSESVETRKMVEHLRSMVK